MVCLGLTIIADGNSLRPGGLVSVHSRHDSDETIVLLVKMLLGTQQIVSDVTFRKCG